MPENGGLDPVDFRDVHSQADDHLCIFST